VLVTGATGILGSWLCRELLQRKARVVAFGRDVDPASLFYSSGDAQRSTVVVGALEDGRAVERAINEHEASHVFHLGAQTIVGTALRSPRPTLESNVQGTWNVLEACRTMKSLVTAVVVASSDKAYGEPAKLPYTEDMPLDAVHP